MTLSATAIPPARLREIREEGLAQAKAGGRFVDPTMVARSKQVLRSRGEAWAEVVLGRRFTRRSRIDASWPWLEDGDMEALVLADAEEDRARFDEITREGS